MAADYKSQKSHCAICLCKTETVWKDGLAFCALCGTSCKQMAEAGMDTAGPWHFCENCQSQNYYEKQGDEYVCEKCRLTQESAAAVEASRPQYISYIPKDVTSGSLLEITYSADLNRLPNSLSVGWLPRHGQTSIRLLAEDLPKGKSEFVITVEVPLGATSAVVRDAQRRSKKCTIPIDYISKPNRNGSLLKRLFG